MALSLFLDTTLRQLLAKVKAKASNRTDHKSEISEYFSFQRPCLFVLSTGRTGTQTLASLLNLADNVFAYHEPEPKLYGLGNCFYKNLSFCRENPTAASIFKEAFLTARRQLLSYSIKFQKGYIETSPQVTFLAPVISALIPKAKFIHCVRDPRAVIRSGMRRNWYRGNVNDRFRIIPDETIDVSQQWSTYTPLQKNAWLWAETHRNIEAFLCEIDESQRILIHSEKIFSNEPETIHRLFKFIDASPPPYSKVERILNKRLNNQVHGNFPPIHQWEDNMLETVKPFINELALGYGYPLR